MAVSSISAQEPILVAPNIRDATNMRPAMYPDTQKAYMEPLKAVTKIAYPEDPATLVPTSEELSRLGTEQTQVADPVKP